MEYDYTLPISGKTLKWKPLTVQQSLDERATLTGQSEEAAATRLLIARITQFDGKVGQPSQLEWGQWDDLELEFLAEEIREKEGARRAALRKSKVANTDPMADVKRALTDLQQAATALGRAATVALEAAEVAQRAQDPSKSGRT